ncbi:MAG: murein biosynthesis integral membrane protein MurJ [Holosporaceae bacterium]|jgi:putative peptidoglycan lipid II flippase|nr:murein biosynthesis integral membrane protein MurJ [Holosporaceae bacterium]
MSIAKAAATVGGFTLFSRIVGLIRECVMAFCLGAGMYSDSLLVALRISSTFRRIFAEGAFNASFLPRFSKILDEEGKDKANAVLSEVFSFLLIFLIPFSIIVIIFCPYILKLLVSGFDFSGEKFRLTVSLGRIAFPYLIFISITSFLGGVLNTINKFALPAISHSFMSIFSLFGLLTGHFLNLSEVATVYITTVFILISGVAQSYLLSRSVKQSGFIIYMGFFRITSYVKDIMKNMVPGIIGAGVWQLNLLVDTTISSYLPTGTITCINLADRLNQFPLGTIGIAIGTALLPILSRFIVRKEYDKAWAELERGLLFAFFMTIFATALLASLSEQIVVVAFQRGEFDAEHAKITASMVVGFSIGLPAYVLIKIFSTLYFATGDTKSPVIFSVFSVLLNIIFLFLLIPFLKYFGLAVCTSLSAIFNIFMLVYFLNRKMKIRFTQTFWYKILVQCIGGITTYFSLIKLSQLYWTNDLGNKSIKWLVCFGFIFSGFIIFFLIVTLCLFLRNQKEWKLWKKEAW